MYFSRTITALAAGISAVSAAVLPRQANTTAISNTTTSTNTTLPPLSLESDPFIIRARQLNDSVTLGYMYAEYAYGAGYYATLRSKEEAIVGHLTDTTNPSNSSLVFGDEYPQGFLLYPLLSYANASIAQIYSGQDGTKGMLVNEGGIVDWATERVSWYGEFLASFLSCGGTNGLTMSNSLQPVIGVRTCYCHLVQMDERHHSSQLCRRSVDRGARLEITGWICEKEEHLGVRYESIMSSSKSVFQESFACRQRVSGQMVKGSSGSLRRQPGPRHVDSATSPSCELVEGRWRHIDVCSLATNAWKQCQYTSSSTPSISQDSHLSTTLRSTLLLAPTCSSYLEALSFRPHRGF